MKLSDYTPARVGLGVAGESLPTKAQLDFRLAHARARDAVHFPLDAGGLSEEMRACGWTPVLLRSSAANRNEYLRRPDKGRRLSDASASELSGRKCKTAIVVADGLSALAVHRHAVPFLKEMSLGHETALWIVLEGRVAVGDHIGELLQAELSIVVLGERPGLTTPDSLGVYLTWAPRVGRTDAERNCISNIHGHGLSYAEAAHKLAFLMNEARKRKLSGVALKETAGNLLES